jgi:hypothetical protein
MPKISIEPGTVPNDKNAMVAEFAIKNIGYLTLPKVAFECVVNSGTTRFRTRGNMTQYPSGRVVGQQAEDLPPSREMRRNCSSGGPADTALVFVPYPATYDITVFYTWPWIGLTTHATRHFASRARSDGHVEIVPAFE